LTQSRGGWLATAAGLAAVAWLLGNRVRWLAIGAGVAVLAGVALTPHGARVSDRLAGGFGLASAGVQVTPENFAVQERLAHWRAGWAMAKRYPLLGVGAGGFSDRYREFTKVWRFRISRGHAHNAYIHAAAQSGFIGLTAYLVFVVTVGLHLWQARRAATDAAARAVCAGAIGVSLTFAVHGIVDYLHVLSLPVQLACAWALVSAAGNAPTAASDPLVDRTGARPTLGRLGTGTIA
jgi:O-antigen ligase